MHAGTACQTHVILTSAWQATEGIASTTGTNNFAVAALVSRRDNGGTKHGMFCPPPSGCSWSSAGTGSSARCSQQTFTILYDQVCLASSPAIWSNSPPVIRWQLSSSLHLGVQNIWPQIQRHNHEADHWTVAQGVLVPRALVDTLMLKHSICYGQKQQNTLWVQIREAVPPNHTLPGTKPR